MVKKFESLTVDGAIWASADVDTVRFRAVQFGPLAEALCLAVTKKIAGVTPFVASFRHRRHRPGESVEESASWLRPGIASMRADRIVCVSDEYDGADKKQCGD